MLMKVPMPAIPVRPAKRELLIQRSPVKIPERSPVRIVAPTRRRHGVGLLWRRDGFKIEVLRRST